MSTVSGTAGNFAKNRSGALCGQVADSVRLSKALSDRAKAIFSKPYRALVDTLNISERDAHYRLSGARKYTAADISKLLQSEDGLQFLVILMEGARPKWWKAVIKMAALGSIEQRRGRDLKLMRRVFDADRTTATKFTDSFRAQDPDYFGVVLEGFDEAASLGVDPGSLAGGRHR